MQSKEIYVVCTDTNTNEKTINKIIHARLGIENEGFNELKNQWNLKHCYIANENAIDVIMQMIMISMINALGRVVLFSSRNS